MLVLFKKKNKNSLTKNNFRMEKFIWFLTKFKTNIDKSKLSNGKVSLSRESL